MTVDCNTIGIHENVASAEYHSWPHASNSRLKVLEARTPAHLKADMEKPKDSEALRLGSAVHCLTLEPERMGDLFAWDSPPNKDGGFFGFKTKAFTEWSSQHPSKTCITGDMYGTAIAIASSVLSHPTASALLQMCPHREMSCVAELYGSKAKARIDAFDEGICVDIKTTSGDAGRSEFERAIGTYGYGMQGALYLNVLAALGVPVSDFCFIVVESEPPHCVAVHRLDDEIIDIYERKLPRLLELYYDCMTSGVWPGWPTEVQDIAVPAWLRKTLIEQDEAMAT